MSFNGDLYPSTGAGVVMTTKGDMVDYDTARQRLGIGSTGQVLTVASTLPTWATLTTADSVLTTQGDVLYEGASALARLGFGTSGDVLTTKGTGANPVWETPSASGTLVKVTKTYSDIVVGTTSMAIYTLPADQALVNVYTDITTVFDLSTAVTIGDGSDDNGFQESTNWTSGTGLTSATRGAYVSGFKGMRSTSGTTAISAYNFTGSAGTPIVKDAQDTTEATASGTELTISSFTVADNSNRILIVCTASANSIQEVSGITWNADEDFTRAVFGNAGGGATRRAEIWYLVNPTATTADIVTTWGSAVINRGVGVYSYYNVAQTDPVGVTNSDTGSGTDTTGTITPTSTGSLIVDSDTVNETLTDTLTAGWTNETGSSPQAHSYASQYDLSPTIGVSNDMFYVNDSGSDWTWCGAEIKGAVTSTDTQGAVDFYLQIAKE